MEEDSEAVMIFCGIRDKCEMVLRPSNQNTTISNSCNFSLAVIPCSWSRPPEMIRPFILHPLYQSAAMTAKLYQERNQSIASLEDMKKALTTMGRRWQVASKYFAPPQTMYYWTNVCSRCLLSNPLCKGIYSFSSTKIGGRTLYPRNVTKWLCRICATY